MHDILNSSILYVFLAFIICLTLLKIYVWPFIISFIDQKIETIKQQMNAADQTLQDAKDFLKEQKKREKSLPASIQQIHKSMDNDACQAEEEICNKLAETLAADISRETHQKAYLEGKFAQKLHDEALSMAIAATKEKLENLSEEDEEKITDDALEDLPKKVA